MLLLIFPWNTTKHQAIHSWLQTYSGFSVRVFLSWNIAYRPSERSWILDSFSLTQRLFDSIIMIFGNFRLWIAFWDQSTISKTKINWSQSNQFDKMYFWKTFPKLIDRINASATPLEIAKYDQINRTDWSVSNHFPALRKTEIGKYNRDNL